MLFFRSQTFPNINVREMGFYGLPFSGRKYDAIRVSCEISHAIVAHLQYRGYDAELLVPEFEDIPLKERGGILHERVFVDHVEGVAPYMDREAAFSDEDALIALFEDLADTELSLPDEGIDGYELRLMKDGEVIGE